MKKMLVILAFIFALLSCTSTKEECKAEIITVEINFDNVKAFKTKTISWKHDLTALEALQFVTSVETHSVGEYVFVSAIDSVRGIRGEKAWYYKVNGESPGKLAINNIVNLGDTITWIYKEDVCSKTVGDCKEKK